MPIFPLALVVLILLVAVGRWIARSWWRGELEDETLERLLPRRKPPEPLRRPQLRVLRGGRAEEPPSTGSGHRRRGA